MADEIPTVETALRVYVTDSVRRTKAKHRRERLALAGRCINGEAHGLATDGVLCRLCRLVHRGERESYAG